MRRDIDLLLAALRPLSIDDHSEFDRFTSEYPPYSDFDFPSLWSWNVSGDFQWGLHLGCLFIRFADYETNEPFFSFLGSENSDRMARALLTLSGSMGWPEELHLVPESCAHLISEYDVCVTESENNFDYIYDVIDHIDYSGARLKSHRGCMNGFFRQFANYSAIDIKLNSNSIKSQLLTIWDRWGNNKGYSISNEACAFERFLSAHEHFNSCITGIEVNGTLAAFDVTVIGPTGCGNSLFSKADVGFRGINSVLSHEVAKQLVARDCHVLNFEQDLGIPGLRRSKRSFAPRSFLKKYDVRWQ